MGGYAVQMAVALGAHVTATCRGAVDYVKDLGAERVIDFSTESLDAQRGAFGVVIDTVGGETLDGSFACWRGSRSSSTAGRYA